MAEVFVRFANPVVAKDGNVYRAQACGAPNTDGKWEGWIEFLPADGGPAVRSSRETTQPNRKDTAYWATGLTPVYLEGALERALHPLVRPVVPAPQPVFDGPAPHVAPPAVPVPANEAVLDPFSVYTKGETLLRKELHALSAEHLVNIITAYDLSDEPVTMLNRLPASPLVETIITAVSERASVWPGGWRWLWADSPRCSTPLCLPLLGFLTGLVHC